MSEALVVASWNVNSIKARIERVLAYVDRVRPDVLCLQEIKCESAMFPREPFEARGYHCLVSGQKTYNGVAILSRKPIELAGNDLGGEEGDDQARFLAARWGQVTIMSVYAPNGQSPGTDKYEYKLRWFRRLRSYLDRNYSPGSDIVLVGDLNVAPEKRDVHDPDLWCGKILFSEPEREAFRLVMDFGFEDTLRLHHPEGGLYSWWDYRQLAFPKNHGLRIDFVLTTPSMAQRCSEAWIAREERKGVKPSDHAPCLARFEL